MQHDAVDAAGGTGENMGTGKGAAMATTAETNVETYAELFNIVVEKIAAGYRETATTLRRRADEYESPEFLAKKVGAARLNLECAAKLKAAGLIEEFGTYELQYGVTVVTDLAGVRRLRKVIGCRLAESYRNLADREKRTVRITLKCDTYPDLTVEYVRGMERPKKGAAAPAGRCRIEKEVSYRLVCDRPTE